MITKKFLKHIAQVVRILMKGMYKAKISALVTT